MTVIFSPKCSGDFARELVYPFMTELNLKNYAV